jgi:hypothetical protein
MAIIVPIIFLGIGIIAKNKLAIKKNKSNPIINSKIPI